MFSVILSLAKRWLYARAKEPSTWLAPLGLVAGFLGYKLDDPTAQAIAAAIAALCAAILTAMTEKGHVTLIPTSPPPPSPTVYEEWDIHPYPRGVNPYPAGSADHLNWEELHRRQ